MDNVVILALLLALVLVAELWLYRDARRAK
jgi:hypothetical protein